MSILSEISDDSLYGPVRERLQGVYLSFWELPNGKPGSIFDGYRSRNEREAQIQEKLAEYSTDFVTTKILKEVLTNECTDKIGVRRMRRVQYPGEKLFQEFNIYQNRQWNGYIIIYYNIRSSEHKKW